jgi:formate dehydrogenase major subunit
MTNSWTDIRNTDLVVIMGGNAAEAHPCGFKWVTEAKASRGAKLIVVDPRFTRSAAVADVYAPIRQGTDIAFLMGLINYCIQNDKVQWDYVKAFTNATYVIKDGFAYQDGLFTGYDEQSATTIASWDYRLADGFGDRRDLSIRAASGTAEETRWSTRRRWWSASAAPRRTSSCRSAP